VNLEVIFEVQFLQAILISLAPCLFKKKKKKKRRGWKGGIAGASASHQQDGRKGSNKVSPSVGSAMRSVREEHSNKNVLPASEPVPPEEVVFELERRGCVEAEVRILPGFEHDTTKFESPKG